MSILYLPKEKGNAVKIVGGETEKKPETLDDVDEKSGFGISSDVCRGCKKKTDSRDVEKPTEGHRQHP